MTKTKLVDTPVGKVKVGPNVTPSSGPTTTIKETKKEYIKIAESGTVPVEKLRDNGIQYSPTY